MKRRIKENGGITLVALVVTIIVLLILAGVSISLVFNNEGLFEKANSAASKYNTSKEEELDFLQKSDEYLNKYNGIYGGNGESETQTPTPTPIEEGVIKHIKLNDGTMKAVNTKNIYGSTVLGYSCERTGVEWQLFYIDEEDDNRVYLISKEYMSPPTTGTELSKTEDETSAPNGYGFNETVLNKFKTTIPNTPFTQKFLSEYVGTSASTQKNLQATNYMLNQDIWKEYLNTSKANYAFGGPTLPLFRASYNDICEKGKNLEYGQSGSGYRVKQGNGNWMEGDADVFIIKFGNINTQKGIYFNAVKTWGLWLASPSSHAENFIIASGGETVSHGAVTVTQAGFRPIVSLNSDVRFIDNADGTYTIS